ncbi:amidase [Roseovarius sp. 217]|uniref:amidase n=1 Tax=Roseovarius sp. (strain 217) TaxID=314264 RepID=UPI0002E667CD|nr:amidase [Roseovarius sp. 217]
MGTDVHQHIKTFKDLATEVATVWHDVALQNFPDEVFGRGHYVFAKNTAALDSNISPIEDPLSFLTTLENLAVDSACWSTGTQKEQTTHTYPPTLKGKSALLDRDIGSAAAMLAAGEATSRDLTEAALTRLSYISSLTNAALSIDECSALAAADRSDARRRAGTTLGDLDGIPLAHKGLFYHAWLGICAGGPDTSIPATQKTATVINRLEAAGAVSIGRLHLTEASFDPTGLNALLGDCLNPWDVQSITGGSSSGSAVACATASVFGALGSDTGGSIRIPAAICGVTGLKPTYGRVSRYGAFPVSYSHDHIGPLARSAADCAALFQVIAGRDAADATTSTRRVDCIGTSSLKGIRIGISRHFFHDLLEGHLRHNIDESLGLMRDAGASLIEVPDFDYNMINALSSLMIMAEISALHLPALRHQPDEFSPAMRSMLLQGIGIPYAAHDHAQRVRGALLSDFVTRVMANVDMLHLPVMAIATPTIAEASPDAPSGSVVAKELTIMLRPFNYLGLPCLSLPCGMHQGASGAQLPQGFQLIGRPFSEARLLEVGIAFQSLTDWHCLRPLL